MTSLFISLLISCALSLASPGAWVACGIAAQEARVLFCGRVVDVSCTGPSSGVTLVLVDALSNSNRRVVIPAEHRHLFGAGIEARYDQQLVCVPSAPANASDLVLVQEPSELVVKGIPQASIAVPDDVARTCDQDVRLPI